MALIYEVTGYDRQTGRLAVSYDVPEQKIALVNWDEILAAYPDLERDDISEAVQYKVGAVG
jgi:uncharacterized protein (DUF433 family)